MEEFTMNRRDVLKCGLAASAGRVARALRAFAQAAFPEPADQARGAVLGRRRERHRRPAMGRADEARRSASVYVENQSAARAARSASWRSSAPIPTATPSLLGSTSTMVLNTMTMSNLAYDPNKDFVPIAIFCVSTTSIAVHPSVPAKNVKELIAYVKANAGKLSYGSAGTGTMSHLSGELFKLRTGLSDVVHVPYKGAGPGIADLVSGHIPIMSPNITGQLLQLPPGRQDPDSRDQLQGAAEGRAGHPDRHRAGRARHDRATVPRHLRAGRHAERRHRRDRRTPPRRPWPTSRSSRRS